MFFFCEIAETWFGRVVQNTRGQVRRATVKYTFRVITQLRRRGQYCGAVNAMSSWWHKRYMFALVSPAIMVRRNKQ